MTRSTRVLATAVLVIAVAGTGDVLTAEPASAGTCSSSFGVSVVVDFGGVPGGDGGIQTGCVADGGGRPASSLLASAGFDLSYVQNEPGFVCRISNLPSPNLVACVNTPPEDAYWALFWSDGTSGTWNYSNYGVGTLKVPDGGYVGFAWSTGSRNPPGLAPAAHAATPTPTAAPPTVAPTTKPTKKPTPKPTSPPTSKPSSGTTTKPPSTAPPTDSPTDSPIDTATGSATPSATATTATPTASTSAATSAAPTPADTVVPTEAAPTTDVSSVAPTSGSVGPSNGPGGALPAWVVPVVIIFMGLGAGAIVLARRRRRTSP